MKFTEFPPFPQPKHLKIPFDGETVNDGVFSLWNGHRPNRLTPRFLSGTNSWTTSTICAASSIRSIVEWSIIFQRYQEKGRIQKSIWKELKELKRVEGVERVEMVEQKIRISRFNEWNCFNLCRSLTHLNPSFPVRINNQTIKHQGNCMYIIS